jgi:hypothetical protein
MRREWAHHLVSLVGEAALLVKCCMKRNVRFGGGRKSSISYLVSLMLA